VGVQRKEVIDDRVRAVVGCFEVTAFIGRADELEALAEVAREASDGLSGAIVVGEPGSGKSRLLAEARERAGVPSSFAVAGYEPERHGCEQHV